MYCLTYIHTVQSSPAGAKRILFRSTMMQKKWSKISIRLMYQCVIIFNYFLLQVGRQFLIWGHSQTTFTRRGRQVVQKCPFFVNVYTIENVNTGGQVVKRSQNRVNVVCERPLFKLPVYHDAEESIRNNSISLSSFLHRYLIR